jgi:AbrB family looped-hinge helix DNA binding protein
MISCGILHSVSVIPKGVIVRTVKVSTKGWVVIPKALREKYGLKKGTHVQVVDYGEVLALVPVPDDPAQALHGMLEEGPSLTADLLSERAKERAREEKNSE